MQRISEVTDKYRTAAPSWRDVAHANGYEDVEGSKNDGMRKPKKRGGYTYWYPSKGHAKRDAKHHTKKADHHRRKASRLELAYMDGDDKAEDKIGKHTRKWVTHSQHANGAKAFLGKGKK